MLYKEAQKLGLDIGDLEQYGFKLKGKHLQLQTYDEFLFEVMELVENDELIKAIMKYMMT